MDNGDFSVSKDGRFLTADGHDYVFVRHNRPRCHLCEPRADSKERMCDAVMRIMLSRGYTAEQRLGVRSLCVLRGVTGYWRFAE